MSLSRVRPRARRGGKDALPAPPRDTADDSCAVGNLRGKQKEQLAQCVRNANRGCLGP